MDERVMQVIEMEDHSIIPDLRAFNSGRKAIYDEFWSKCDHVLHENIGVAVDDRRHTEVTHVASVVSIRDLHEQAKALCSPDSKIPSIEWLRLQFTPKNKHAKVALHHTGRLKVRFMIQKRQWRHSHPDSHYAACIFRYMREYAVRVRENCLFICLDDKHKVSVGEPGFPVAAVERGRRVIVRDGVFF